MSQVYKKSFSIIILCFVGFLSLMIAGQGYFFYKSKKIENSEKTREILLDESESLLRKVGKNSNEKFDFFNIDKLFKNVNSINSEINKINNSIGVKNLVSDRNDRVTTFQKEFSELNLGNKNLWKGYVESYTSFLSFVREKNWKTLTRIGTRVNIRTPRRFSFEKDINYLLGVNLKDLALIQDVTKKSTLTNADKKEVLDRSEKLIILTNLLIEKNIQASKLRNAYFLSLKSFDEWAEKWKKKSNELLQKRSQEGFMSAKTFFLMVVISFLFMAAVFYITKKVFELLEERNDRDTIIALDKIVVKDDLSFLEEKNDSYRSAIFTLNDYVKRRISFGQIFQQTIPFPCILLDENLSFKWFNQLLIEQLNLEQDALENENLVWDMVRDRLQLSEDDPVLEAIQGGIAGIFQVRLDKDKKNTKTFQMYVNPVTYNNKKFVMLILYPLLTIEETMNLQFKTIVSPVHKSLDAMIEGNANNDFWNGIRKEFVVSESLDLYEKFISLDGTVAQKMYDLKGELEKFEELTTNLFNTNSSVKDFSDENLAFLDSLQENFRKLKGVIVKLSDQYQNVVTKNANSINKVSRLFSNYSSNVEKDFNLNSTISKMTKWGIPSINEFKSELKKFRMKLKSVGKIANKDAQEYLANQEKVLTNIDLFLSKLEMLLQDLAKYKLDDNSDFLKSIHKVRENLESDAAEVNELASKKDHLEEELVSLLKSFYQDVRELGNKTVSISEAVVMQMPEGAHDTEARLQ